jgi:hypothetical protein
MPGGGVAASSGVERGKNGPRWPITEANGVCRNIKKLFNFKPPATDDEIRMAALQFVRKISGFARPSVANEEAFNHAVDEVAKASSKLLGSLVTTASPRSREVEAARAHLRAVRRFGSQGKTRR